MMVKEDKEGMYQKGRKSSSNLSSLLKFMGKYTINTLLK